MARFGSALANGVRQYAVAVDNAAWYQLESSTGALVNSAGLSSAANNYGPVMRWRGQMGTGTTADQQNRQPFDYTQGVAIQNTSTTLTLYVTTTDDQTGGAPTSRAVANAFQIGPGKTLSMNITDASKIYLRASAAGPIIASILLT